MDKMRKRNKRTDWKNGKWQFRRKKKVIYNHNSGSCNNLPNKYSELYITLMNDYICTIYMIEDYQICKKFVNG